MLEERLLTEIQRDLPLTGRPYLFLARRIGSDEDEVVELMERLREEGRLRHFGPIFNARSFGYESALVAFRCGANIDRAANIVASYPGVSHCYEREGDPDLWFTVAVPPDSSLGLEGVVERLAKLSGIRDYTIFRAKKTFKLSVNLSFASILERDLSSNGRRRHSNAPVVKESQIIRRVVLLAQESLPLVPSPFLVLSQRGGLPYHLIIATLRRLKATGAIRKFSGILSHRKEGFSFNALTLWEGERADLIRLGCFLSTFKAVSHCYIREGEGTFFEGERLFAMVHAKTLDELERFLRIVRLRTGADLPRVYISRREFVKRRLRLFTEDFYEWERGEL